MGRVLLAFSSARRPRCVSLGESCSIAKHRTPSPKPGVLRRELKDACRPMAYAIVDQELELGLRSIAVSRPTSRWPGRGCNQRLRPGRSRRTRDDDAHRSAHFAQPPRWSECLIALPSPRVFGLAGNRPMNALIGLTQCVKGVVSARGTWLLVQTMDGVARNNIRQVRSACGSMFCLVRCGAQSVRPVRTRKRSPSRSCPGPSSMNPVARSRVLKSP